LKRSAQEPRRSDHQAHQQYQIYQACYQQRSDSLRCIHLLTALHQIDIRHIACPHREDIAPKGVHRQDWEDLMDTTLKIEQCPEAEGFR